MRAWPLIRAALKTGYLTFIFLLALTG